MIHIDDMTRQALDWLAAGKQVALATVVETWGSAPRPVGAQLAISGDMEIAGSVSGGCVEGAVVEEALEALQDGTPRILEYGVTNEEAFAVGLACGGKIRVLVEPLGIGKGPAPELLRQLADLRAARRPAAYVVDTQSWERQVLSGDFPAEIAARFARDASGFEGVRFVRIDNPPLRMIIVGAVHIAQQLVQMARLAGYDPLVVDPRAAFASVERFGDVPLFHDWPDTVVQRLAPDVRTAVVTLSHDPKIDDPALHVALRSDAFYIGSLGSRRTHAKRVDRLLEAGFSPAEVARIHAPVGADIGAATPAEIAVSVMAEITACLRRPEGRK